MDILTHHRKEIDQILTELQIEFEKKYHHLPWAADVFARIFPYSKKGKLLRGGLVIFGAQIKGVSVTREVLVLASLMELIHSALLIHDDIIDGDGLRRGEVSIHQQYGNLAKEKHLVNTAQMGSSMGICVGDIMFFMVFEVLSQLETSHKHVMLQVLSHELITVGFGQMQDVWPEEITQEKILELYMYKTGRYSFSLPMILGSLFGGEDVQFMKDVTHFGEAIGQLYQLTDDSLGLYGDAQKIGKPVGSDIKEGKQTLYWYLLLQHVTNEERETLLDLKGKDITESHILFVKQLISRYAITEQIAQIQKKLEEEATMSINNIKLEEADKHVLLELVAFVTKREK